jgi:alpha-ribazole phosphatase
MIFLRHPKPGNASGLCYGRTDLDIGLDGGAEIAQAMETTPKVGLVIASPALRCRRLAEELAARDGVALRFEPRLWELNFGEWEGVPWAEIGRAKSDLWASDPWHIAPPGGETFAQLHARVGEALAGVAPGTALVCHAGPIRVSRMILTGAGFETVFAEAVPYASPIRFVPEVV